MKLNILIIASALIVVTACNTATYSESNLTIESDNTSAPETSTAENTSLESSVQSIVKSYNDCLPEEKGCTYVMISYPKFSYPTNSSVEQELNNQAMIMVHDNYDNAITPENIASSFIEEYAVFNNNNPDAGSEWYKNTTVSISFVSDLIVCLEKKEESYKGGAHGNHFTLFQVHDLNSGKLLKLRDLTINGDISDIESIAEHLFRENSGLSENTDLEEVGFFFEGGQFNLTENFTLTNEGLLFFYNTYEIQAYSEGTTELLIPYSMLESILMPQYLNLG